MKSALDDLCEAFYAVLTGGNHVALLIGAKHPPYSATHDEAREHYKLNHGAYEAWCCWRAIMIQRDAVGHHIVNWQIRTGRKERLCLPSLRRPQPTSENP